VGGFQRLVHGGEQVGADGIWVGRASADAGLIKSGIHRLAGIARSTLGPILGAGGGGRP
jgi:hypothetical protein